MKKLKQFSMALLLISGSIILITSCNTTDDDIPTIFGTWKVTGAVFNPAYDPGSGLTTDAYSLMFADPCSQDDLIIFQENGTVISDEGVLKCDTLDPQQTSDNYTLSGTTLSILGNDTLSFTNVSIGASTLTGTLTNDFGGGPANVDMTLTRE